MELRSAENIPNLNDAKKETVKAYDYLIDHIKYSDPNIDEKLKIKKTKKKNFVFHMVFTAKIIIALKNTQMVKFIL